jgi:hypothetical protein
MTLILYPTFNVNAPPEKSLLLEILEFKFLGSEGSTTFGRPSEVLGKHTIKDTVSKLQLLFLDNESGHAAAPSTESKVRTSSNLSSPEQLVQFDFSTQVQQPEPSARRRLDPKQHLLAILNDIKSPKIPNPSSDSDSRQSIPAPKIKDNITGETSKLEPKASSQSRPRVAEQHATIVEKKIPHTSNGVPQEKDSHNVFDSENENSQESKKCETFIPLQSVIKPAIDAALVDSDPVAAPVLFFDPFQERFPFGRMKRVPRRYIQIPTAQRRLLDHNDAWYEPEESGCPRYANIPLPVQTDLNRFMDQSISSRPDLIRMGGSGSDDSSLDGDTSDDEEEQTPKSLTSNHAELGVALSCSIEPDCRINKDISNIHDDEDENLTASSRFTSEEPNGNGRKDADYEPESSDVMESLPLSRGNEGSKSQFQLRMPLVFPSSSPAEEEELEIAFPFAVGDRMVEHDTPPVSTPHNVPSTAPQSSRSVQVERTPHQSLPYERQSPKTRFLPKQSRPQATPTSVDNPSDPIIPATFNEETSSTLRSYVHSELLPDSHLRNTGGNHDANDNIASHTDPVADSSLLDDQKNDSEDAPFEEQPQDDSVLPDIGNSEAPPSRPRGAAVLRDPNDGQISTSKTMTVLQPSPTFSIPSSPIMNITPSEYNDKIQVPTTQLSPVNMLKRDFDKLGSHNASVAKKIRSKIVEQTKQDHSPPRDTKEMARLSRHAFNGRLSAVSTKNIKLAGSLPNSPNASSCIQNTNPGAESTTLRSTYLSVLELMKTKHLRTRSQSLQKSIPEMHTSLHW